MRRTVWVQRLAWLSVGLAAGVMVGWLWPQTPLHATATDRVDTFAVATGQVDEEVEALYFLDFLTGDLRAAVMGRNNAFQGAFAYNVMQDFKLAAGTNPKFLMVTGANQARGGGAAAQQANSVLYVAEVTTGQVAAYTLPWVPGARSRNVPIRASFKPLDKVQFRAAPAGGGPGT
jgi:hypothetical protein